MESKLQRCYFHAGNAVSGAPRSTFLHGRLICCNAYKTYGMVVRGIRDAALAALATEEATQAFVLPLGFDEAQ